MDNCCICSDARTNELVDATTLPCGHSFHSHCLSLWLWQNTSCPLCRACPETESNTDSELEQEILIRSPSAIIANSSAIYSKLIKRAYVKRHMATKILRVKKLQGQMKTTKNNLKTIESTISKHMKVLKSKKKRQFTIHNTKMRILQSNFKHDTTYLRVEKRKVLKKISDMKRCIKQHKHDIFNYATYQSASTSLPRQT